MLYAISEQKLVGRQPVFIDGHDHDGGTGASAIAKAASGLSKVNFRVARIVGWIFNPTTALDGMKFHPTQP